MKLTILGGGGFRVPLVYGALLRDQGRPRIDQVMLYDVDPDRLSAVAQILAQAAAGYDDPPAVTTSTDLTEALTGTDFVFSAIRVGGPSGRSADEHQALDLGVLGQETVGPGGIAYGWRTVPVAVQIAETTARVAPQAWVINFTNPAGMITEAMRSVLGSRVVGICDSPIGLARRAARALGLDPTRVFPDYAGLNHLGWLQKLIYDGVDVLPRLLADSAALQQIEEVRLIGADWIRALGSLPNEYLYYLYFSREAIDSIQSEPQTRGDYLRDQQATFFDLVAREPDRALEHWTRVRGEREASYLAELREEGDDRSAEDLAGGGYENVALAFMAAVMRNETTSMIVNVANQGTLPGLPDDAVVEVPCLVDSSGARPVAVTPLTGHRLGLVLQLKEVERLTIAAALTRDVDKLAAAFALHPLVDSVSVGRQLAEATAARD